MDREKQRELDQYHAAHPQEGDFWQEMLCGILVVLKATHVSVTFCQAKKQLPDDKWTWDLTKVDTLTRGEFRRKLQYSSMPDKTWCSVCPQAHSWAVEKYNEMRQEKNKEYYLWLQVESFNKETEEYEEVDEPVKVAAAGTKEDIEKLKQFAMELLADL